MTIPAWPTANCSAKARDGWQMSDMFVAPLATDMEGGNQRLRSKPGSNVAVISYPLEPLTFAQFGYFDTFMRTTLNNGASRFTMPITINGAAVTKTVQLDSGKSPQVYQQDGLMYVTLPLRVWI